MRWAGGKVDQEAEAILAYIRASAPELYDYVARGHFRRLMSDARWLAEQCRPNDRIVDFGSFPWFVPAYLTARGFQQVTAVDIARPDTFEPAPDWGFERLVLDVETESLPMEDRSVDVVVLFEIFEHLYRQPNAFFRELARVIAPGGESCCPPPTVRT